jgi:dTDP-L-rhamnose 4-epimerase
MLNGRAPLVFEDGRQMRDFVSVHDVVAANLLALEREEAAGMAMNVGSGEPISICEIASVLGRELGRRLPAEITGKYRAGDIRHCFADINLAARVLGYRPQVRFAEGIRELAGWLDSQTAEDRVAEAARQLDLYGLTA